MSDPLPVESRAQSPRAWVAGGLLAAVGVFAFGALGGFYAAQQSSPAARAAGGEHAGEGAARKPALDPRTLENLGVEVAEVAPTEFVRTREVPAVVEGVPGRRRACRALVGGVVTQVLVEPGQKVDAGAVVAHLRRDPFPRATLALTEGVLRPLNEEYHGTVETLRASAQALSLARGELERVRRIMEEASAGSGARIPGKVEIDLQNEERRAERALENARQEAARHACCPTRSPPSRPEATTPPTCRPRNACSPAIGSGRPTPGPCSPPSPRPCAPCPTRPRWSPSWRARTP